MFGNGKSAEERQREKDRKKRGTRKYGQAKYKHSHMGVVSCVLSILGINAAVKGFRERERNYITCKIGLPVNGIVLILFLVIFIGGLM